MALNVKVGSFAQPAATGNQVISGVGFTPKIVIFFGNKLTADGSAVDAAHCWGSATSSTQRWAASSIGEDGPTAANHHVAKKTDKCYCILQHSTTPIAECDFVSFSSDGFTINWTIADATARIVNYIAIGGSDLMSARVGNFDTATGTGNQVIGGVGFRPDSVLLFCTTDGNGAGVQARSMTPSLGLTASPTAQAYVSGFSQDGSATSFTARRQSTSQAFAIVDGLSEGTLSSYDADGFTINWTTAGAAKLAFYIALQGVSAHVGSFNQPTSNGNQVISGLPVEPHLLMLASFNNITAVGDVSHHRMSMGFGRTSSERACIWHGDQNAAANMICDQNLDRSKIIKMMTEGTPTTEAAADLVSLDTAGFTINWTATDATAREIIYWVIGPAAAPDPGLSSFYGSVSSFRTLGSAASPQNLFTIENAANSPVLVALRRLTLEVTYTAVLTAVESQVKISRPLALPSGGTQLAKVPGHTDFSSNVAVVCRGATASDGGGATAITATAGSTGWQKFIGRIHTAVGHITAGRELDLLAMLDDLYRNEPYDHFVLKPGQAVLVQITNPTGGNNPATNHYIVNCSWKEILI